MKVLYAGVETDVDKLHAVSEEVTLADVSLVNRVEESLMRMFNCLNKKVQGLAAVQCGEPYRAILLRYEKGKEPIIIYNPKVLFKFGRKQSNEGCASEGDKRYIVYRPLLIKVEYYTKYKDRVVEWLPYSRARIFMHEYDHLNGILLQDKGRLAEE